VWRRRDFSCEVQEIGEMTPEYDARATAGRRPQPGDIYIYNALMSVSKLAHPQVLKPAR
jgi:hypothetical protein